MTGAETRDRGDCSKFMGQIPHFCKKNPEVIDLLANVHIDKQIASCCKGGVLSSAIPDSSKAISRFLVTVGGIGSNKMNVRAPQQFTFQAPGYTCGSAEIVQPTVYYSSDRRRELPVFSNL